MFDVGCWMFDVRCSMLDSVSGSSRLSQEEMRPEQERRSQRPDANGDQRPTAAGGNNRASRHQRGAYQDQKMSTTPAMERPPESQTHRPQEVEILGGIGAVGVGTKLSESVGVDAGFDQKQQRSRALEPLNDSFQSQQPAVHRQDPQQTSEPRRNRRTGQVGRWTTDYWPLTSGPVVARSVAALSFAFRPLVFGAFLTRRFAQQPIAHRPKRTRQPEITPKGKPGQATVETVRKPFQILMIFETELLSMIGGPRIDGADQAIAQDQPGERGENSWLEDGRWAMGDGRWGF